VAAQQRHPAPLVDLELMRHRSEAPPRSRPGSLCFPSARPPPSWPPCPAASPYASRPARSSCSASSAPPAEPSSSAASAPKTTPETFGPR
jgi:hypothetical protein